MRTLTSLAAISFTGPDARNFLQGQLSNDLTLLTPQRSLLACCNSAQGRVQAVLHLIERTDRIVALLPQSLREMLITRLRKYQLRAKVQIAADPVQIVWATRDELSAQNLPIPGLGATAHHEAHHQDVTVLHWPDASAERFLLLQDDAPVPDASADAAWQLADIRAGLPQVGPATHESFVAQMLNLDVLGGISFNKGCYTGQEIIARAHFRGAVKRSMVRFQANCPAPQAGSKVLCEGGPAGEVVMAADSADGCELLAVISLSQQSLALTLAETVLKLNALPLPYQMHRAG